MRRSAPSQVHARTSRPPHVRGRVCRVVPILTVACALAASALVATVPESASAQQAPRRELRGVWLTTLSGLDWPAPADRGDIEKQKRSLTAILDRCVEMKLNAVFFQVRSRGNAFYASELEPWAAELTGTFGRDPGWDPLAFAVDACHARGLEIHAWFNVFKVWSGGAVPQGARPAHVAVREPSWVRTYNNEVWIDPGIPAARTWLADVAVDIARRYDIDALHLDYVRYPDADFADEETWRRFGRGASKADWRRANVTAFVREASERIARIKPRVRIGAAPIGIYENLPTARGWQGLHAISQDSRAWLREGIADYLAPQVYWGLRARGSSIDFESLVRDWSANDAGRHIYIGMAPYKDDVKRWLGEHIDACRAGGAEGGVFFRYAHIADGAFGARYATRALPPASTWRDHVRPNPPRSLALDRATARLAWRAPAAASDGEDAWMYVVHRLRGGMTTADPASILALLPHSQTAYTDAEASPGDEYAVTALDRAGNESEAATTLPVLAGTLPAPSITLAENGVSDPVPGPDGLVLIAYTVAARTPVRLRLMDARGAEALILVDEEAEPGTYVVGIERARLAADIERYVFEAGSTRMLRAFAPGD